MKYTNDAAKFISGVGSLEPFNLWHRVKRIDAYAYTTACDLYIMSAQVAVEINDITLSGEYCTSDACGMRRALSEALNKCASENRQSEWRVTY